MKVEIKEVENCIEWTVSNLLTTDCGRIVFSSPSQTEGKYFHGIEIKDGYYSSAWVKELFKPFNGTITLQND